VCLRKHCSPTIYYVCAGTNSYSFRECAADTVEPHLKKRSLAPRVLEKSRPENADQVLTESEYCNHRIDITASRPGVHPTRLERVTYSSVARSSSLEKLRNAAGFHRVSTFENRWRNVSRISMSSCRISPLALIAAEALRKNDEEQQKTIMALFRVGVPTEHISTQFQNPKFLYSNAL
jgi:hypothetical protein